MKRMSLISLILLLALAAWGYFTFLRPSNGVPRLTPTEFHAKHAEQPGVILDVRTPGEFAGGHLPAAVNMDWLDASFKTRCATLDPEQTYYVHCASGVRSNKAVQYLQSIGFKQVFDVGGYEKIRK
jgi:phage shock protein E